MKQEIMNWKEKRNMYGEVQRQKEKGRISKYVIISKCERKKILDYIVIAELTLL